MKFQKLDGLKFYIDRATSSIKELKNKVNNLEKLLSVAKERLQKKEDSPKVEKIE